MQHRTGVFQTIRDWTGLLLFGAVMLVVCSNLASLVSVPLALAGTYLLNRTGDAGRSGDTVVAAVVIAVHLILTGVALRYVGATSQAVRTLIGKYLWRRWIAWVALLAVMLCTTMVLVVISVMGGWLDMFENTARGLTGDVVIKSQSLSGFPHYERIIEQIESDPALKEIATRNNAALRAAVKADPNRTVVVAAPTIVTYGVVNIENKKTDAVQVIGYPLDKIGRVNRFPESLYHQHTKYVEQGKPPPAAKSWDRHEKTDVPLANVPEDVKWDEQTGKVQTGDAALTDRTFYKLSTGQLVFVGKMTEEQKDALLALSPDKEWAKAVRQLANVSNWPGMIPSTGVLDIRKNRAGEMEGREPWKYDLWVKMTVVGVGADEEFDAERAKAERQYRIADDSRTGMWQYDSKTVYVPFEVLQQDLGMGPKPISRLETLFVTGALNPARVLGVAPHDGKYSLLKGRSLQPAETIELKAGDVLGFRAEGDRVVAVAGDQKFDAGPAPGDAVWKYNRPDVEPARTTDVHVKLPDGIGDKELYAARDRIEQIVGEAFRVRRIDLSGRGRGDPPKVETWEQASALYIGAIKKEKLLVTLLFGIISIVAIFLIFCIFYMIVAEKTKDIGIIKSVGATGTGVAGIFLGYGLAIGLVGAGLGWLLSYLIVHNINEIHDWIGKQLGLMIWNPEVYAFDRIPNQMATETPVILSIALVASVLGALVPAIRAAMMHPVEALRWE